MLRTPSLAERATDVPLLARLFLRRAAEGRANFLPDALNWLAGWGWPGNVRELRAAVECAPALAILTDFDAMMGALSQYALRAGEKLRQHDLVAGRLTAFFHTNRHKPDRPQYAGSRGTTLHPMTSDSLELIAAARRCADRAWRDGYAYTKAGILLDDLTSAADRQRTLFEGDSDRRDRLMAAIDHVNGRFGKFTVVTAGQGFKRQWRMRSDMRSPAWTTSIAEVPIVKA